MTPREILQHHWGYEKFRPLQEEIIQAVLDGRDTVAILPTGGGKSVCFQVPGLALEGLCLVVSPLIALMQDQLAQLQQKGIPSAAIYAGMTRDELTTCLHKAAGGELKFLYVSPERLETETFRRYLPHLPLNIIAVDEAHCISQWGYDFRPSYLHIADIRHHKKGVPVLALTASATPEVREDIISKLRLIEPGLYRQSFERPNLSYSVFQAESRFAKLSEIIKKVPGTAIVYCKTRKKTREFCSMLQREGINASFYHAGLDREERKERQEKWIRNETRVIVCTNAFGMGIDKPDVRLVVHTEPPECLENYYQEAGRAGRDGKKSYAVLLHQETDLRAMEGLAELRFPPMATIRKVYQALANYLQLPSGLGEESSFPIDIQDLSAKFKLPLMEIIHSLKAMQQGGILEYQEELFMPSSVQFIAGKDMLPDFSEMNPGSADTIKAMLRSYGGIFEHPVAISEKQLARLLWKDLAVVQKHLEFLHASGIIRYMPRTDSPRIRFLQDRVKAEDLYIEPVSYQKRKAAFAQRVEVMMAFIAEDDCRARYIGRYFGDAEMKLCGICDRCLARKRTVFTGIEFAKMEADLRLILKDGDLAANELMQRMQLSDKEKFWKLLTYLEAEEMIMMTDTGMVSVKGKKKGPG